MNQTESALQKKFCKAFFVVQKSVFSLSSYILCVTKLFEVQKIGNGTYKEN